MYPLTEPLPPRSLWLLSLGILVAIMLFAGYRIYAEPSDKAVAVEVEEKLANVMTQARAVQDPWTAFKQLNAAEAVIMTDNNPQCPNGECLQQQSRNAVADLRVELLDAAIRAKRPAAFLFLYSEDGESYKYTPLRKSSISSLMEIAERATGGTAEDRRILMLAANLVAQGNFVMRDTSKAVEYYARAWAADEESAANLAAQQFLDINDLRNAYLWSLRCTGNCKRNASIQLDRLESALSPEAAKQIQKSAASRSVVELDTAGS